MQEKTINFMKYKYVYMIISFLVIVGGIAYGLITGYKFDVDFKGGTSISAELNCEFDNNEIQSIVKNITGTSVLVQKKSSGNNAVSITTDPLETETLDKVIAALEEKYPTMSEPSTRNIQASYSKELLNSALLAIGVAIVLILLYIVIRFKTLGVGAAIAAIIALIHDSLFIIAVYGVIKFPINTTFVAVILTIIGYSINDTIVVFDRIRENRKKVLRSKDLNEIVNISLTQCLGRTIVTSLTTVVTVIVVFIFAFVNNQEVLMQFSLPLILGVIVGTYSSMFIVSPLWIIYEKFMEKRATKNKKK